MKKLEFFIKDKNNNEIKLWINWEEYKFQLLWYEFMEKLFNMTGINCPKEIVDNAKKYLINKYPEYKVFEKHD